jgi:hypothetical protein
VNRKVETVLIGAAADALRVSRRTIYNYVRRGYLKMVSTRNGSPRITKASLMVVRAALEQRGDRAFLFTPREPRQPKIDEASAIFKTAARRLIGADGVTLVLREGLSCHYVEEDAISPLWKGQRFPMSACVSGWVMEHVDSVIIPDIYADPRVLHEAYRPTFVKSMAMVPVGEGMAAIGAYWRAPHVATATEMEMLRAIGDSAAIAFQ